MAQKRYKSAMGRVVDIGALMLENENVRAVGNMNVNARGDTLDSANRVIESKTKQVQKHYQKQSTNTSAMPPTTSTVVAKKQQTEKAKVRAKSKEKVVNNSVLDAYNDERLVSVHDKTLPDPVEVEEIPEIESLEELAELEALLAEVDALEADVEALDADVEAALAEEEAALALAAAAVAEELAEAASTINPHLATSALEDIG
jgi:hypothetical protein